MNLELGPAVIGPPDTYRPVMGIDDPFDDGKAETRSGHFSVGAEKPFEDFILHVVRNRITTVDNTN